MLRLKGIAIAIVLCAALWPAVAGAQERGIGTPPPPEVQAQLVGVAQTKLREGEESFARGDFDHARTAFDAAMDVFLNAGYDLRSNAELQAAYRETVERVHRYQILSQNAEGDLLWPMQAYEATPDDFRVEEAPIPQDLTAYGGEFSNAQFLVRLGELQRRFRSSFGREFIVTGRDTHAHSRLYGSGRAADVRVRDLSASQVQFIVKNARQLNMRVLDFSTSDRVYQHNLRVIGLGRPLDTLATGVHLHLNDQPRAAAYRAEPAAKKKVRASK